MTKLTTVKLKPPYLILLGDISDSTYAKTGYGIVHWRPDLVAGQLRLPGCKIDLGVPEMNIEEAHGAGVRSLVIGVAPIGGDIPDQWWSIIEKATLAGLDIVCGLHTKLRENPRIIAIAKESGAQLIDVRVPPANLPVGTGSKRSGKRLLMVGTDCAIGKKYTALAIDQKMRQSGMKSTFRATGQTGIMLAGEGIPIDAVVSDFISGAAELISPQNDDDHWDIIEGQGSLFHPGYAGVSLGLLHGSQPDAFVVCHSAERKVTLGWEHYLLPSISECIDLHIRLGKRTNPDICCVGISVNTSMLSEYERENYLADLAKETDLPCVDPLIDGCAPIISYLQNHFDQ